MKSFIPWIGGKSLLANKIISMFPEKIDRYIEIFGGGGSVLFAKEKHAPLEVYNDANGQLVNPLICIINIQSPDDFQIKRNKNCRQFPRLASMQNYLLAHYLSSYQYELKQALLNGETELEIPHMLDVHVENIRFLNFHFYKKSFSEVYVDAFFVLT